ncbi:TetR family transcriptional regulator [Fervidicella metallireducens AeB]|uniref:TetR family transcriptional regulator n=1 Tax=Fervidicella metallireducens AeB TaxID=1403537 RepID=A0A017RT35_9CLOT|nr:TetR/AcrR family transcriptional regulator [Fervidicella metallireducens]EYE87923.1 TetR family transcriptional regulator [Fervidicella metallireducens AeB]
MQVLKDELREKILISAVKEFSLNGFEKASMRAIAKKSGMTAGNMYRYFKNKEALFEAVLSPVYSKIVKLILEYNDPPREKKDIEKVFLNELVNTIVEIEEEYRDELLILIEGSKGSRFEFAKDELLRLIEERFRDIIKNNVENENLKDAKMWAKIAAAGLVEGMVIILKDKNGTENKKSVVNSLVKMYIEQIVGLY